MNGKSLNITEEKLGRLREIMPEVFAEGKLDWEKLRVALAEQGEFQEERYHLNWAGKTDAFRTLQMPTTATLAPCPEESIDFDSSNHVFIEGENLEVLKILQKSYFGKIKMIYIDPPYNTGNDHFIYPDRFAESKNAYLKRIGDRDEQGCITRADLFRKNSRENGHFHSNWLSMLYPRLFLARNLLCDDGVIFISIDDNEVHNLRMVMNEIFGEEQFIESFVWRSRLGRGATAKNTAKLHEYVVVYAQNADAVDFKSEKRFQEKETMERLRQWGQGDRRVDRPTMYYPIQSADYGEIYPIRPDGTDGRWRVSQSTMANLLANGEVVFKEQSDGRIEPYRVIPAGTETSTAYPSIFDPEIVKTTAHGSIQLRDILGAGQFSYPKPSTLVKEIVSLCTKENDIILDFFAGSCTTAHAVMQLNAEDGGKRKFICVQMPEPCDEKSAAYKAGYKTIADIGKERIRRAAQKIGQGTSFLTGDNQKSVFSSPLTGEDQGGGDQNLSQLARQLRKNSTKAEQKLWHLLCSKQAGVKFRRQQPLGNYIVGFVCLDRRLVIEVDGGQHGLQIEEDTIRTEWLQQQGYQVLRFWNNDILQNPMGVWDKIVGVINSPSPQPSPVKGEGVGNDSPSPQPSPVKGEGVVNDSPLLQPFPVKREGVGNDSPLLQLSSVKREGVGNDSPLFQLSSVKGEGVGNDSPLPTEGEVAEPDLGFKVFKLRESNFKIWQGDQIHDETTLKKQLEIHTTPLLEGAKTENILYELLLKSGFSLTAKIADQGGWFMVCDEETTLALVLERINATIIKTIIEANPQKLITLDHLFHNNDQLKTNTALQMEDAGITFEVI